MIRRGVAVGPAQSYVERAPRAELAGAVRTVWVQRSGASAYVQRHLPTGGVELHVPIGRRPQLLGPLTGPKLEVVPPHTTLVGIRFHPGMAPPLPVALDDLVDGRCDLADLWGGTADRLGEAVAAAPGPEAALALVEAHVLGTVRESGGVDPLVAAAVRHLMPWPPVRIRALAAHLAISPSQLRRRCLDRVGIGPKALQRTLRFQGFLALAQAGAGTGAGGTTDLAADVGYADRAHLGRECRRLTGLTPTALLGATTDRCACSHDHTASFQPFLARRSTPSPTSAPPSPRGPGTRPAGRRV